MHKSHEARTRTHTHTHGETAYTKVQPHRNWGYTNTRPRRFGRGGPDQNRTNRNRADVLESDEEEQAFAKVMLGTCRNSGQQEVQDASGGDEHAHDRTWETRVKPTGNQTRHREAVRPRTVLMFSRATKKVT